MKEHYGWDKVPFKEENEDWDRLALEDAAEERIPLTPSQFVETAVMMPNPHTRRLENFSFGERGYLQTVYDCQSPRILMMCGRQVEKSTTLANKMLAYSCLIPHFKTLYVSPSSTQTKEFSKTRIKEMLETCPDLRTWFPPNLVDNILEKKAINRSQITLRYAFLNADRCRGLSADLIALFLSCRKDFILYATHIIFSNSAPFGFFASKSSILSICPLGKSLFTAKDFSKISLS